MKTNRKRNTMICIAVVLAVVLTFSAGVLASAALLGDINGDGIVTASDARAILRYSAKLDEYVDERIADIDQNGKVEASDARTALRISARLEPNVYDGTDMPDTTRAYAKDQSCPYCGSKDCPAVVFDPKLGVKAFDPALAVLCPEYREPDEPTEEPVEVIPEPCEYCGSLSGHNDKCPLYEEALDASLYCQACHMELGFGPDKCVQFNIDIVCPECGESVPAWTCHHCAG